MQKADLTPGTRTRADEIADALDVLDRRIVDLDRQATNPATPSAVRDEIEDDRRRTVAERERLLDEIRSEVPSGGCDD